MLCITLWITLWKEFKEMITYITNCLFFVVQYDDKAIEKPYFYRLFMQLFENNAFVKNVIRCQILTHENCE